MPGADLNVMEARRTLDGIQMEVPLPCWIIGFDVNLIQSELPKMSLRTWLVLRHSVLSRTAVRICFVRCQLI